MKKQDRGVYLLFLKLKEIQKIRPGKLSQTEFKPGIYLYVGRAKQVLQRRLERHLRKEKKFFWHIDYFLQKAEIEEIWIRYDFFDECWAASELKNILKDSLFPLEKFGSSDCRFTSHLIYLPRTRADLKSLRKKLSLEKINIHGNQA